MFALYFTTHEGLTMTRIVVLMLLVLAAPLRAADPAKTQPTGVCSCVVCTCADGKKCDDATCPAVAGKVAAVMPDLNTNRYATLYALVQCGNHVVLAVGTDAPVEHLYRASFPSGFMSIADGVYDCRPGPGGVPVMTQRGLATYGAGFRGACAGGSCGASYGQYSGPQNVGQRVIYYQFGGGCPGGNCPK